ncbi:MAG TPA: Rrf2 family transcriptional regulator [Thiobacillus sp.]
MQLTRFTDYSLRVLIYLGLQQDRLVTISEIASNYDISRNHLMKVVHQLGARGYIETVRGKGGGMRLARRPELINVGDVVRDAEENMDIAECFNPSKSCPLLPTCVLRTVLTEARKSFLATLDFYRLSDLLVSQPALTGVRPLQKMPAKPRTKMVS